MDEEDDVPNKPKDKRQLQFGQVEDPYRELAYAVLLSAIREKDFKFLKTYTGELILDVAGIDPDYMLETLKKEGILC